MKLSSQVEGYIQEFIIKYFSWSKIKIFGNSVGVNTNFISKKRDDNDPEYIPDYKKDTAMATIMNEVDNDIGEIILRTFMRMTKKADFDGDRSEQALNEINPILEQTMKVKIDLNGEIHPLFDDFYGIESKIPIKLRNNGFDRLASDYKDAYVGYSSNPKGSVGTVRTVFEGLVVAILNENNKNIADMKSNLIKLETMGIIKEIDNTKICSKCQYKKRDSELNYAYDSFSLLSHYGNHPSELTDEIAEHLFVVGSALINFLIKRYEIFKSMT